MESGGREAFAPPGFGKKTPASRATGPQEDNGVGVKSRAPSPPASAKARAWDLCVCDYVNPVVARIRRRPLFQKIIIANTTLIVLVALGIFYFHQTYYQSSSLERISLFVFSGIAISVLINFLLVRLAFHPLDDVGEAINAIRAGHRGIRVPEAPEDPQIENLSRSLNQMLDAMETARKRAAASVITAQEEERRRIARELHDETSQALTSLIIGIKMAEETIPDEMTNLQERLNNLKDLAHQTLNEVHNMAVRLRPSILDDLGLAAALRSYGKELSENGGIQINMQLIALAERLSPEMETVLYRVVQEALTNVARHSGASMCQVRMRRTDDSVQCLIEDDGKGFYPGEILTSAQGHGLGMHGMRERIELVGGQLEFESEPGKGTSIFLEVPIGNEEAIW